MLFKNESENHVRWNSSDLRLNVAPGEIVNVPDKYRRLIPDVAPQLKPIDDEPKEAPKPILSDLEQLVAHGVPEGVAKQRLAAKAAKEAKK